MTDRPKVLQHLGAYSSHEPVAAFGSISDRAHQLYLQASGGHAREGETPLMHVVTRMVYIGHATSLAIRLNASWALSHPALSLLRDRYEQAVRFSWLARQSDNTQMVQYIATYYAKSIQVFQNLSPFVRQELTEAGLASEDWLTEKPTKEQRAYLNRWNDLDLRSMAEKRDRLPPLSDASLARQTLADLYVVVYSQFSSVTHYDMYGLNMLGLHKSPSGEMVLAPDPHFPSMINLFNSLFDLIQFFEVTRRFLKKDLDSDFDKLFKEWDGYADRVTSKTGAKL